MLWSLESTELNLQQQHRTLRYASAVLILMLVSSHFFLTFFVIHYTYHLITLLLFFNFFNRVWWWFSHSVMDFATPWTLTCYTPLSVGFSRQDYWSGSPFPSPRDLPDPGIQSRVSCMAGRFFLSHQRNP